MKILIACDYGGPWGGAQVAMLNEVEGLKAGGHQVKILSSDFIPGNDHLLADYTFRHHQVNTRALSTYIRVIYNFRPKALIEKVLKEFRPDIIHMHLFTQQISPSILYLNADIPIVATVHDCSMFCPIGNKFIYSSHEICHHNWGKICYDKKCISFLKFPQIVFRNFFIRKKEHKVVWIAPSDFMKNELLKAGFTRVLTEPYGFDLNKYNYSPVKKRGNNRTIIFYSRLDYSKGTQNLVHAFRKVVKEVTDANLIIVGSGSQFNNIKHLINELKLQDSVKLMGWLDQASIKDIHLIADLLAAPFLGPDNQPLVVCESMLLGTPVVATDVGGVAELIENGKSGFLVAPDNIDSYAKKVVEILRNKEMAQQFSAEARQKAEKMFEMEGHIKKILNIYDKAMA
jgi:glycosyltransferase involved in cell wall biosynthesis